VQGLAASLLGFGGTWRLVASYPTASVVLGALLLLLAVAAYGVAFAFLERRAELARNFYTYATLRRPAPFREAPSSCRAGPSRSVLAASRTGVLWLGIRYERSTLPAPRVPVSRPRDLPSGVWPATSAAWPVRPTDPGRRCAGRGAVGGSAYLLGSHRGMLPLTPGGRAAQALLAILAVLSIPGLLLDLLPRSCARG